MSASPSLYHSICVQIESHTTLTKPRRTRLALLLTGLIAAQTTVLARIARDLHLLHLTPACRDSIARRLRRVLATSFTADCYLPAVRAALPRVRGRRPLLLAVDESSHTDRVHLLRVGVPYWGNAVPLAWAVWAQNQPLPDGEYWQQMDTVFAQAASVLPPGTAVCVVADRAYSTAPFFDRCTARGWQYVVRYRTGGAHRFRDGQGREWELREYLARYLTAPGQRWKGTGWVLKKAGWRKVAVVATWTVGYDEPLVVVTNGQARWQVLTWYERRFWIEAGFRGDKSHGWQWEASGVVSVERHAVLLLAMAWATLLALWLGVGEAREALRRLAARTPPARPQPAHESVFTHGLTVLRAWLLGASPPRRRLRLSRLDAPSWCDQWLSAQTVRP